MRKIVISAILLVLLASCAFSLPIWTEETYTLPPGVKAYWPNLYLYLYDRDIDNTGTPVKFSGQRSAVTVSLENQFFFGFNENTALRLVVPMSMNYSTSTAGVYTDYFGVRDLEFKGVYRFKDEDDSPALAALAGFTLPTGNYALEMGNGTPTYNLIFIADKRFDLWKLYFNLGYLSALGFDSKVDGGYFKRGDLIQYNLAADYIFNKEWIGVIELIGSTALDDLLNGAIQSGTSYSDIFLLPEISYILNPHTMIFGACQIPVVYNKAGGVSGITPLVSMYYTF